MSIRRRLAHSSAAGTALLAIGLLALADCAKPRVASRPNGVSVEQVSSGDARYTVVRVCLEREAVELYWKKPDGTRYATFSGLRRSLEANHRRLVFATNAGIFEPSFIPTGLHVEAGSVLNPLNRGDGLGNFYLKPNGVFLIDSAGAHVVGTDEYAARSTVPRLATQSGPLLLGGGRIHPQLKPGSSSKKVRSGVGVVSPSEIVFVLSDGPVSFFEMAVFFRDRVHCQDALYLDGTVSRFYLPGSTSDDDREFAGLLAVSVPQQ